MQVEVGCVYVIVILTLLVCQVNNITKNEFLEPCDFEILTKKILKNSSNSINYLNIS